MTPTRRLPVLGVVVLIGYDTVVRPWMRCWGATEAERVKRLPGDEIVEDVMTDYTRAVTIDAPPAAVWPWLVQIGDRRAGFYSYDWIERFVFAGTVHYIDRTHSATMGLRYTPGSYVIGPYLLLHQRVYRFTRGVVGRHLAGRRAL